MTLNEAFQGSICIYIDWNKRERSFEIGPRTGYIDLSTALNVHRNRNSTLNIIKIIPSEKAKKWLNDNYFQEYPLL